MNLKKKGNILILTILLIVLIVFLGIFYFIKTKTKKNHKEGFSASDTSALTTNIQGAVNTQLSAAGLPTDTPEAQAQVAEVMNQMTGLIKSETDAYAAYKAQADASLNLISKIDTSEPSCPNQTFLKGTKFSDGFCSSYSGTELNAKCGTLTAANCNQTSCCALVEGTKCVAGNANGPTYLTENGRDIDYSYYSYKNKCYGACSGKAADSANPCSSFTDTDTNLTQRCIRRLWAQTGCPNTGYISPEQTIVFKDYNKITMQSEFKNSNVESNVSNCYGEDETMWPAPCFNTKDSDVMLTARCMTDLFTKSGCKYTPTVNDTFIRANRLTPKSGLVSKFATLFAGKDDASYTKCYGADEKLWPDPCLNTTPNSNDISPRCVKKLFKESGCTNIAYDYSEITTGMKKSDIVRKFKDYFDINTVESDTKCYGSDRTKWPSFCKGTTDSSKGLSRDCVKELYQKSGCTNPNIDLTSPVIETSIKSKIVNVFKKMFDSKTDTSMLSLCYGTDKSWPKMDFKVIPWQSNDMEDDSNEVYSILGIKTLYRLLKEAADSLGGGGGKRKRKRKGWDGDELTILPGEAIYSNDRRWYLIYQKHDGNLVLYPNTEEDEGKNWLWGADRQVNNPGKVVMQNDGNLVIYNSKGEEYWSSGTGGLNNPPYRLTVENNRNVYIVDRNGEYIWQSDTWEGKW